MDRSMKITVCELRNGKDILEQEWQKLVSHAKSQGSDLIELSGCLTGMILLRLMCR